MGMEAATTTIASAAEAGVSLIQAAAQDKVDYRSRFHLQILAQNSLRPWLSNGLKCVVLPV